jgi:phosphoenolpyruvate carboxylase
LLTYLNGASPIEEIALLKMGSRPARRFGAAGIADLRAIPWVFAWTQNRHMLTGWYGVGAALSSFVRIRGGRGEELLREMFERSRVFRLIIDEVEKSLTVTDLEIGAAYASLVRDEAVAKAVLADLRAEFATTIAEVKKITGSPELAARFPNYRGRLERVRPLIDRTNLWQVELLREFRAAPKGDRRRKDALVPLLLSMNCIATGLGWTG